jgi:hypothetical protein
VCDHPVCGAIVGFAEIFLMPQPPLLTRRGLCLVDKFVESIPVGFTSTHNIDTDIGIV